MLTSAHVYAAQAAENRRPQVAREHFAAAIATAEAAGNVDLARRCSLALAYAEFEAGARDAGLQRYELAMAAMEPENAEAWNVMLPQYATMLICTGRLDEAADILTRVEAAMGDDVRITTMVTAATRARLERHRGRLTVARRHARRAAEMIEQAGVARLEGLPTPTLALVELAAGHADAAISELARGAKAAADSDQMAFLADILDAATLVAMATNGASKAGQLLAAADALRRRAQVQRGDLEQAELDAALAGLEVRAHGGDELDVAGAVDIVVGLANG
jgi:ATP/maltotriose-dependent transcriptional regulator MalT